MNTAPQTPSPEPGDSADGSSLTAPPSALVPASTPPAAASLWRRLLTRRFLLISILVHLLFGLGATALVVQTMAGKRKLTFVSAPPSPNRSTRATEHRVQMAQRQKSTAPAQAKRITTTAANAKVALPAMPALPALTSVVTPARMAGLGGAGFAIGAMGGASGGSGGGGGPVSLFGFRGGGKGLKGTFYDLKQTSGRLPTNMTPDQYGKIVEDFARGGFNLGILNRFFRSDKPLYTNAVWIPNINADEGPAAFQVQNIVQPKMWLVHYQGKVTAPDTFTFHFVGAGDDVMMVKFNGRLVLDRCWYVRTNWRALANYEYAAPTFPSGFAYGDAIKVEKGGKYDMEVLIGEQPGGRMFAALLQEIEGAQYEKDAKGNPILPVFRMSDAKPAAGRGLPPHREDGPVWKAEPMEDIKPFSVFDH